MKQAFNWIFEHKLQHKYAHNLQKISSIAYKSVESKALNNLYIKTRSDKILHG